MRGFAALLIIGLFGFIQTAYAQSADGLHIQASIVQCGSYDELPYACDYDQRCCALKDQFYVPPVEIEEYGDEPFTEINYDRGYIITQGEDVVIQ